MSDVNILIIDDSKDILFALSAICELENYNTTTLEEGSKVKEVLNKGNYNMVIVDYHMPKMDGIEVVCQIRQVDKKIPILVLTVEESRNIANRFLEVGANDFALKPIKAIDIISRIKVHLKSTNTQKEQYTKGISNDTMAIILGVLQKAKDNLALNEISQISGLSYQTVHKYISHLIEKNMIIEKNVYGKQGRPKKYYHLR